MRIEAIKKSLVLYQTQLREMVKNKYEIVGYARKSPSKESLDMRTELLKKWLKIYVTDLSAQKFLSLRDH